MKEGYGYHRWASGNEYYGQLKEDNMQGEGVEQEKGMLYTVKYKHNEIITKVK